MSLAVNNGLLQVIDVEHGACAMLHHTLNGMPGRLAMIDSGDASPWTPSATIKGMNRATLDYLFITNADQDHMSDLQGLWDANISVPVWYRNPSFGPAAFEYVKNQSGPLTRDARRYLDLLTNATAPVPFPFDANCVFR